MTRHTVISLHIDGRVKSIIPADEKTICLPIIMLSLTISCWTQLALERKQSPFVHGRHYASHGQLDQASEFELHLELPIMVAQSRPGYE